MAAVIRHMEQRLKRNPPRVLIAIGMPGPLPDQDRRRPIQLAGQISVGTGTEQGRRQRVGVHQLEIPASSSIWRSFSSRPWVFSKKAAKRALGLGPIARIENFTLAVDGTGKSLFSVLEIVQRTQPVPGNQIAEEGAGGAVRRDPRRHDDTRPPRRRRAHTARIRDDLRDAPGGFRFPVRSPRQPGKSARQTERRCSRRPLPVSGKRPVLRTKTLAASDARLADSNSFRQPRLRCSRVGHLERLDQLVTLGLIGQRSRSRRRERQRTPVPAA